MGGKKQYVIVPGMKFGELITIKLEEKKDNVEFWLCKCSCGNYAIVRKGNLHNNHTRSCGCLAGVAHNSCYTRIYRIYQNMVDRCTRKNNRAYPRYGGRGIKVCDEWMGKFGFVAFRDWAYSNGYDETLTLDRINVNGGYSPANCRWVTMKEQANNKRNNALVEFRGKTQTVAQWCDELNLPYNRISYRLNHGWSIEDALTTPKMKNKFCFAD